MAFLDIALDCIRRGWHVFPCWPRSKRPMTHHGKLDATLDEAQVRAWWAAEPKANPAISCGPSGLCVLDMDEGPVKSADDLDIWITDAGIPPTLAVRTGRRTSKKTGESEFGVQLYYAGAIPDVGLWKLANGSGQVKSLGGYVMAAGSIHPDSGAQYEVLWDVPIAPTPDVVRGLKTGERESLKVLDGKKIPDGAGRHHAMTSVAGTLRARGLDGAAIYEALIPINPAMCETPIDDDDLKAIAYGVAKRYPAGEPEIEVVIGKKAETEPLADWRTRWHSFTEMDEAPPPTFLIDGFLQEDSITGLAAPVAQRKSIIALNIAHALCTGEALFGHFAVTRKPSRVLYACPEMGLISFTGRVRKIGLLPYVGKTLFCSTMNSERFRLDDLTPEELLDSVVIMDTAIRFLEGDESKSQDMQVFAASVFRLKRDGAAAVIVLHHSPKSTKEASELTLENVMRGSGELGAFLTSCWATRLVDPNQEYKSPSFIKNVKQRDFESDAFEATCDDTCKMTFTPQKEGVVVSLKTNGKDKDRFQAQAVQFIREHPDDSALFISNALKELGIKRSRAWVQLRRAELKGTGNTVS